MNPTEKQVEFLEKVPTSYKSIIERSFTDPKSRTNAIKAKCLCCAHFVREEIRHCTVTLCPLHLIRPYQVSDEE